MENIIKKAIEGGYVFNKSEIGVSISTRNVCDPLFWQALGKACGWVEWTMKLSDVVHDWEVEFYKPDTAKTPVYVSKKCYANKELDVISVEYEYQYQEVKENDWTMGSVVSKHGGIRKPKWKEVALCFHEINLTQGWDSSVKWLDELVAEE